MKSSQENPDYQIFNRKFYLDLMLSENIQSCIQKAGHTVYNIYSAFKSLRLVTKPFFYLFHLKILNKQNYHSMS